MKKSIVFLSIIIVVIGMVVSFRIFVSETSYDVEPIEGQRLMEMEHETTDRVEALRREMGEGLLSEEDCRMAVEEMASGIFDNLFAMKDGTGNYLHMAYCSNVIRQLGLALEDRSDMLEKEKELKRDPFTIFANKVFNYCLDVSAVTEEEAEYIELSKQAKEIQKNLDEEIDRYTKRIYTWYSSKSK